MIKIFSGLLAIVLIAACHSHSHENEGDHMHDADGNHISATEPEPLVFTQYTDRTELFVEFDPLVAGQECRFAAHFTALGDSFRAIGTGTVKLSLTGEAGKQSITAHAPQVPGIFRLRMTPEKPGLYQLIFDIKTPEYTDQVVLDSISVYPDEETALQHHQPESGGGGNEITYLKEQAWKIDFATQAVQRTAFANVVRTSGVVVTAPGDEQTISAQTAGIVRIRKTGLFEGSAVGTGQVLFSISSQGLTDRNTPQQIREAQNDLEKAKADLERSQKLYDDRLLVEKEYLQVKNAYANAENRLETLTANYGQAGQDVRAGQPGFVKSLFVTDGQFVETGTPLAVISRNKKLVVRADLSQTAFSGISGIASANFRTINGNIYSLAELNGRLVSIGKSAESTLFIPVHFEVNNRDGLTPGTFIEIFLKTNAQTRALVVPASAVMEEQGTYFCYVQTAGESFEKRELRIGSADGRNIQVLSGLKEGERVVIKGAYNIKLSTASGTLPAHGHEH
ncbi:MAG: efflux RND transporter periplasmic adaptor subunit [Bacteroidetes bacterium]|nr:MAG: efflux RND transporter periplasmic adaptor subunit [Bacteroidota bacterium]